MKKIKHNESEMVKAVRELESGVQWDGCELGPPFERDLVIESKAEKMYADLALENKILKDVIAKI